MTEERKYSSIIVDGLNRAFARAMRRAVGFIDQDFNLPQFGIASTWGMVTASKMHTSSECRTI